MQTMILILRRELLTRPRDRWFYAKRLTILVVGGVILWIGIGEHGGPTSTMGLVLFRQLSMAMILLSCFIAPYTASAMLTREHEDRTLAVLWLTDLRPVFLLAGKLSTGLFASFAALLSLLPLLMFTVSLGGVSTAQMLGALAIVLANVFMASCMGLFCGSLFRRSRNVRGGVFLLALVYYLLLPIGIQIYLEYSPRAAVAGRMYVDLVSPPTAVAQLGSGMGLSVVGPNCAFSCVVALAFLAGAAALLPRTVLEPGSRHAGRRLRDSIKRWKSRRAGRRPPIFGNPVAWRDTQYRYGGDLWHWKAMLIVVFTVALVPFLLVLVWPWFARQLGLYGKSWLAIVTDDDVYAVMAVLQLLACACTAVVLSLSHCSNAFSRERRGRTLEALLGTEMGDGEILWGKIRAILFAVLPWLAATVAAFVLVCMLEPPSG